MGRYREAVFLDFHVEIIRYQVAMIIYRASQQTNEKSDIFLRSVSLRRLRKLLIYVYSWGG